MEAIMQKYMKYFYITFLVRMTAHLLNTISIVMYSGVGVKPFILMAFSITNLLLLGVGLKYDRKQQFSEIKTNARILRWTIGIRLVMYALFNFSETLNWISLIEHFAAILIAELILTLRIKHIEHLEKIAHEYALAKKEKEEKGG